MSRWTPPFADVKPCRITILDADSCTKGLSVVSIDSIPSGLVHLGMPVTALETAEDWMSRTRKRRRGRARRPIASALLLSVTYRSILEVGFFALRYEGRGTIILLYDRERRVETLDSNALLDPVLTRVRYASGSGCNIFMGFDRAWQGLHAEPVEPGRHSRRK